MKWILALIALAVCASPIELIPDLLPFGSADDIFFAMTALQAFKKDADKRLGGVVEGKVIKA